MDTMPVLITFRRITRSDVMETQVRERAASLRLRYFDLMKCRVLLSVPHRHLHGTHVRIRIELTVSGGDRIVVTDGFECTAVLNEVGKEGDTEHDDSARLRRECEVMIREAFESARRRLDDLASTQRILSGRHYLSA